jgi:hypothetical protein
MLPDVDVGLTNVQKYGGLAPLNGPQTDLANIMPNYRDQVMAWLG